MSAILASLLLVLAANAKVLPRDANSLPTSSLKRSSIAATTIGNFTDLPGEPFFPTSTAFDFSSFDSSSTDSPGTFYIPIPSPAETTTSTTVSACTLADGSTIDSVVIIGHPAATFSPGITKTIPVPPQVEPTIVTFYDYPGGSNETEVIMLEPLPGFCGPFPSLVTDEPTATPSVAACPAKGCSGTISRAAELVINAINEVTQLSAQLQRAARLVGEPGIVAVPPFGSKSLGGDEGPDAAAALTTPILAVSIGLGRITLSVTTAFPTFLSFPPFEAGCNSDTVVLAWLEFVRVHQELLSILIGRASLLERGPVKRSPLAYAKPWSGIDEGRLGSGINEAALEARASQGFVGRPIAVALRKVEGVVDTLAVKVGDLVPTRGECSKAKSGELKKKILEAQGAYEG